MAKPKAASAPMASEPALTVETFIREWLEAIAYSVRPRTWRRYSEYLQLHVVPALGETELGALGSRQISNAVRPKGRGRAVVDVGPPPAQRPPQGASTGRKVGVD